MPPIKIGHFGLHHFNNSASLPIDPRTLGDPKAKTFIVDPGDPITVIKGGVPIQATLKKKKKFIKGVWQNPTDNKWYPAFYYNRRFPIGNATGPDLHVTYYDSVTAGFRSRTNLRNALSVFRYKNSKPPAISHFRLFAQEGSTQVTTKGNKKFIADNIKNNQGTMDIPKDKGVDIVITTASFGQNSNSASGIHKLSYTVYKILIAGDTPSGPVINIGGKRAGEYKAQSIMHTYDSLLSINRDKQLIAHRPYYVPPTNGPASLYTDVNKNKHTSFVVSNLSGDDTNHWELEDTGAFPDGEYIVRVRAWNIAKSNGEGNVPDLNEKIMDTKVLIETNVPKKLRYITIQKP